ncbi:MAG: ParB N-terminal domain-containing protein [Bradyrhizobium sp.]|uniref:ParB/RepB/Spo0J family partition protein n=1 Tax=Bradyrhizobium sp. TaxID=376 RepID=UPI001E010745|nr:ParB/RepB/Spo0J family partition protein [Bradyrhizobium sp.]MBV9559203.1 ParB N-terminal domain-containing protein [Bradyrhizobium sp.]
MKRDRTIRSIPISAITVLNPRERSPLRQKELVVSIDRLGLKRPITVSDRGQAGSYELICGEGRIEAIVELGAKEIPAILVDAATEDCLLMGLVENIARRHRAPLELFSEIARLAKSYSAAQVAAKLDMPASRVATVCYLLRHGEEQLLNAVEKKIIPSTVAREIARAKTPELQASLLQVHADKPHTSHQLAKLRRLIDQRQPESQGEDVARSSAVDLMRAYRQETDRQLTVRKKAALTEMRLLFLLNALRTLLQERMFLSLLREERLERMPMPLLRRLATASKGIS